MWDASAGALPDGAVYAPPAHLRLVGDAEKWAVLELAAPVQDGWRSAGRGAEAPAQALYRLVAARSAVRSSAAQEPADAAVGLEPPALQLDLLEPMERRCPKRLEPPEHSQPAQPRGGLQVSTG